MRWREHSGLSFLPGTARARLTALLLAFAASPVALIMAYFIDMRAFILWLLMWPITLLPRRWWRTVFLLALIPLMLVVLAQLAPPQASYFMLVILVLSVCEQVGEDGGPVPLIFGVIFPALCVMVLSTNVFVFLLLLVTVIFYAGVYTLRINDMPLSGLRIRLLPIVVALSGSLFFAIAAFIFMPRINPTAIPGLVAPASLQRGRRPPRYGALFTSHIKWRGCVSRFCRTADSARRLILAGACIGAYGRGKLAARPAPRQPNRCTAF